MSENRLFNVTIPTAEAPPQGGEMPPPPKPSKPPTVGVINAPQSTLTFAGAPAMVTIVWKVSAVVVPSLANQKIFPVALSLVVGMVIYWQSAAINTKREKFYGFVSAFLNSFAIAAATLGIDSVS